MTQQVKQVQFAFIGSFLGAMIPVASFAYWLGMVSARVDTLEAEVTRLRDTKNITAVPLKPYGFTTNKIRYEELPTIANTELPLP